MIAWSVWCLVLAGLCLMSAGDDYDKQDAQRGAPVGQQEFHQGQQREEPRRYDQQQAMPEGDDDDQDDDLQKINSVNGKGGPLQQPIRVEYYKGTPVIWMARPLTIDLPQLKAIRVLFTKVPKADSVWYNPQEPESYTFPVENGIPLDPSSRRAHCATDNQNKSDLCLLIPVDIKMDQHVAYIVEVVAIPENGEQADEAYKKACVVLQLERNVEKPSLVRAYNLDKGGSFLVWPKSATAETDKTEYESDHVWGSPKLYSSVILVDPLKRVTIVTWPSSSGGFAGRTFIKRLSSAAAKCDAHATARNDELCFKMPWLYPNQQHTSYISEINAAGDTVKVFKNDFVTTGVGHPGKRNLKRSRMIIRHR